ncbi:ABC transporter substrate-binding protein [Chromobacterium sp. IIBBL 290-4]|uniref:substrate-binding periplasmic protein n=1 Tax=Chromobacterium sp. IIBBL 290-4 TaxID=2953890 RepID=UPI0020B8C8B9|nr:transporter substrate-binding domain-containing protein [Chromobacterium sp. IIBBL 290-4]UTH73063.1 transporter substrate-binding domain-containing protein [Chromobacterium sp. IIBBL 290-4]
MRKILWLALSLVLAQAYADGEKKMVFVSQPFPPFVIEGADGRVSGALVDILHEVCRRLSWRCDMQMMVWKRALLMMEQGSADGMLLAQNVPERRAVMALSRPVVASGYALYGLADNAQPYHGPADLSGRTLAVYGPSLSQTNCERLAQGVPGVTVVVERDSETVMRKLSAGRYGRNALAFSNQDVARAIIQAERLPGLRLVAQVVPLTYHFGLSRKRLQPGMAEAMEKTLQAMCADHSLQRLAAPYGVTPAECGKDASKRLS